MRSVAYDERVTGIILTGRLGDGSSGLWMIKEMGGTAIVQDPADTLFPDMPDNALKAVKADHILPLKEIGPMVNKHIGRHFTSRTGGNPPGKRRLKAEIDIAAQESAFEKGLIEMGDKTSLTCPECGGALSGIAEGATFRYRCHTGHAFSADALWAGVMQGTETHLWQALRSMEEAIILLEQAATESHNSGNQPDSDRFHIGAERLRLRSRKLLDLIYENKSWKKEAIIALESIKSLTNRLIEMHFVTRNFSLLAIEKS